MKRFGSLPLGTALEPMEAKLVEKIPTDEGWLFEPKWDGFRCLAFRDGARIDLRSKSGKPLARYFPDVVELLRDLPAEQFVLDGEIVIPRGKGLSFDDLLQRIHPAESRVNKLAEETPAMLIVFDLLVDGEGQDLSAAPLEERREALERFAAKRFPKAGHIRLSPATRERDEAAAWLEQPHSGLDGVMAKRLEMSYQSGNRDGMLKVKQMRTADCVVGGFRWAKNGETIGSMLLGLYDKDGLLHHVGFCSAMSAARKKEMTEILRELQGGNGFTGREPSGESRWRTAGEAEWERVAPSLVVEVRYDHFSGGRFRHGTKFLRRRPDKDPEQCTMDQLAEPGSSATEML